MHLRHSRQAHLSSQIESAIEHHAGHNGDVIVEVVSEVVVGVPNVVVSCAVCVQCKAMELKFGIMIIDCFGLLTFYRCATCQMWNSMRAVKSMD